MAKPTADSHKGRPLSDDDDEDEKPRAKVRTSSQGRTLRSQEATRFKSELSAYFVDYDEVIGNEPKEQHLLNLETSVVVVDSAAREAQPHDDDDDDDDDDDYPVRDYSDALYTDIHDAQRIDFSFLESQQQTIDDPLPNTIYEPIHRRAQRVERSIRNTEKGRAQHEKGQIIRLLDGLQGHDWLRVMGVSGITETKKRAFEPAREHFIHGCQAILDKFRNWSEAEKKRKQKRTTGGKKRKSTADTPSAVRDSSSSSSSSSSPPSLAAEEDVVDGISDAPSSSPAEQLRQEAIMARSQRPVSTASSRRAPSPPPPPPPPPLVPDKPPSPRLFTSFFSKSYEREAAVSRNRRKGRKVLAWGHPIPDMAEVHFMLPEEYRDEDTLKVRARRKRRDNRSKRS
ncbi:hypothetical protein L249_7831 [Ophiocordyceps polyrhachis-furcata BCC 54312]|uniref:Something about silencing protein 4 domain-containing protein n=1 Tax=Ophiocordyceps polyrhachis-furcata BCC 54312 TaxID=1330021 RepID=A0A367L0L7_9HYPO|nr:hypothetical protein L249_7831 [Ophiocordyceps polyrhachis-furcata BCC 54312]